LTALLVDRHKRGRLRHRGANAFEKAYERIATGDKNE